jgi:diguanylate cyclase (GGDEF)-like protein
MDGRTDPVDSKTVDLSDSVRSGDSLLSQVLLIEDNLADALLTTERLRRAAPDVRCSHVDRLAHATTEVLGRHDCVIVDLGLPDAHGLDALREIRHRDPDIAILVLTGLSDSDLGVEALRHGAQDYLLKDAVDGPALERAIRYAIERKRAEEALSRAAVHDPLTGLLNRAGFLDRLNHVLLRRRRPALQTAVLFCDLDRFKSINDSLGHGAGDELLGQVAHRLRPHLRPEDTLARLGGDEFIALLDDLPNPEDALLIGERIVDAFALPFTVSGQIVHIGVSIGITFAQPATSAQEMLREADTAMYVAKDAGRGCCAVFSPDLHIRAVEQLHLANELRTALLTGQLVLAYQPLVDIRNGQPLFLEGLSRWVHPAQGLISPDEFIGVAERGGFIEAVDLRALTNACEHLAASPEATAVSVNFSSRTLSFAHLPATLSAILDRHQLPASRLWVEVLEGALLNDAAVRNVRALRKLGVRIALDDFGTGYSSLAYLTKLPVDLIKIDKLFLPHDDKPEARALLGAIAQLGHAIGIPVALEGIEHDKQMAMARELGVDYVQGYFIGRPQTILAVPQPRKALGEGVPVSPPGGDHRRHQRPAEPGYDEDGARHETSTG